MELVAARTPLAGLPPAGADGADAGEATEGRPRIQQQAVATGDNA